MPLVCPLCGDVTVAKHAPLMTHIRLLHADDPNFLIQCNRQGCKRTFWKFTVYKNHVYTFHDTTDTDDLSASVRSGTAGEMPGHEHTSFDMGMLFCFFLFFFLCCGICSSFDHNFL